MFLHHQCINSHQVRLEGKAKEHTRMDGTVKTTSSSSISKLQYGRAKWRVTLMYYHSVVHYALLTNLGCIKYKNIIPDFIDTLWADDFVKQRDS